MALRLPAPGGVGTVLEADGRDRLLAALKRGDGPSKLFVDAVVFRQTKASNRNYVRFPPGMMPKFAASFKGRPFLRDHRQNDLTARGGTILESEYVLGENGGEIHQRLELVAPWAIEMALNGLMDRFSIGWFTTGDVLCTICEAPLFEAECWHLPGDKVGEGEERRAVEALVTGADGKETSGVNAPAVEGTVIEGIRAALAAQRGGPRPSKENTMGMKKLAAKLGLSEDASEESLLASLEKIHVDVDKAQTLLAAERDAHAATTKERDSLQARFAKAEEEQKGATIERLLVETRKKVGQKLDAEGKVVRGGTPQERVVLATAKHDVKEAEAYVAELAQVIPIGTGQSEDQPTRREELDRQGESDRRMNEQLGITADDIKKFGPSSRQQRGL